MRARYPRLIAGLAGLWLLVSLPLNTGAASPTGYDVAPDFDEFYRRSGGLAAFGYALGPAVIENNQTVQYFERQRFERHNEHSGTPYEVQLGRLGTSEADARGLSDTAPFSSLAANSQVGGPCVFFAETGHRLCNAFRTYWESHGLEFGDPGVSHRESLALFGYPISEEFSDPSTGLTVQYFERSRFEFHPEHAATEHSVLLGLLGNPVWTQVQAEALAAKAIEPAQPSMSQRGQVLWSADMETGDVSQWTEAQFGEAVFNSGTGTVDVSQAFAHSGRSALRLSIDSVDGGQDQGARIFRWHENAEAAYYSAWFYFPTPVRVDQWWNIFQFKSKAFSSEPMWVVNVGNRANGSMYLYLWDAVNRRSYAANVVKDLPVGRWVHLEAYYQRATSRTGQIAFWQDGELLFQVNDVQTTIADNVHWSVNNYANRLDPTSVDIYVDDAIIAAQRVGP